MALVLRLVKGSELTYQEMDDNLTYLESNGGKPNYIVKNADYTAVAKDFILIDTSANVVTVTLPASPTNFDVISFLDYTGSFDTNNLTVARNGNNIMGLAEDMTVAVKNNSFDLIFYNNDWRIK